jgi:hypothetical protein
MASGLTTPPPDIGKNPDRLYQWARNAYNAIQESQKTIEDLRNQLNRGGGEMLTTTQLQQIRRALEVGGGYELNLTGLVGKSSAPQLAAPVTAAALANLPPASKYLIGTLGATTSGSLTLYLVTADANGVHQWSPLIGIPGDMAKTDADNLFSVLQTFMLGLNVLNGNLQLKGMKVQAFTLELQVTAGGVLQHAMVDNILTASPSNYDDRITGASNVLANTPQVNNVTNFTSGGGVDASHTSTFVFNTAAQTDGDEVGLAAIGFNQSATALTAFLVHDNINVNGTTRKWLSVDVRNAATGAVFPLTAAGIGNNNTVGIQILRFVA